jgi:predicted RNase H-like HicB family nuclease
MSEPLRLTIVYEDAGDGDGWVVARIPHVRGAIIQGATDEEARENVIDALRELLAAPVRFAARAARPHRQRLARADDRGLKSMTVGSRPVAEKR